MKLGFLSKLFEGALSIEKTYNDCDKAINRLREYNEKIQKMTEDGVDAKSFSAEEKPALDEVVNHAITNAEQLVSKKSGRNWPGVFREMHKNLGSIYFEQHNYDRVREECEHLKQYGEVGRQDAEELLQQIKSKETGNVGPPENAAESNTDSVQ